MALVYVDRTTGENTFIPDIGFYSPYGLSSNLTAQVAAAPTFESQEAYNAYLTSLDWTGYIFSKPDLTKQYVTYDGQATTILCDFEYDLMLWTNESGQLDKFLAKILTAANLQDATVISVKLWAGQTASLATRRYRVELSVHGSPIVAAIVLAILIAGLAVGIAITIIAVGFFVAIVKESKTAVEGLALGGGAALIVLVLMLFGGKKSKQKAKAAA